MNAKDYWQIFMETGMPEAYLMYARALKMEASDHVFENTGIGLENQRLQ